MQRSTIKHCNSHQSNVQKLNTVTLTTYHKVVNAGSMRSSPVLSVETEALDFFAKAVLSVAIEALDFFLIGAADLLVIDLLAGRSANAPRD